MTPSQRKAEAVKRKLDNEFAASSSESTEEDGGREEKKRKIDHAKEAHQKLCVLRPWTPWTMLLEKVDKHGKGGKVKKEYKQALILATKPIVLFQKSSFSVELSIYAREV